MNTLTINDVPLKGKRVLVRVDFNVPMKNGEVTDDTRISESLPTIKKILADGGKAIHFRIRAVQPDAAGNPSGDALKCK